MRRHSLIVGIDEAGRGPLAGAVAVGVVVFFSSFRRRRFCGAKDSKQLSPAARDRWFSVIKEEHGRGNLAYSVSFTGAKRIDEWGIVRSVSAALRRALRRLELKPSACKVLLDGGLRAPSEYIRQETLIRGESRELSIALASIVAKVSRDRKMIRLSKRYPQYGFEIHKGYGTKLHQRRIRRFGPCDIHRRSFLKV